MASLSEKGDVDFDFFDDPVESEGPRSKNYFEIEPSKPAKNKVIDDEPRSQKSERNSPNPPGSDSADNHSHRSHSPESPARSQNSSRSRSPTLSTHSSRSRSSDSYQSESEKSTPRSRTPSPKYTEQVTVSVKSKSNKNPHSGEGEVNDDDDYTSDSDVSDVTDVSPLSSPSALKIQNDNQFVFKRGEEYDLSQNFNKKSARPPSARKRTDVRQPRSSDDSINMKLLMEVLDMEHDKSEQRHRKQQDVLFDLPDKRKTDKKNFSFSNDQADTIDRDNQRLVEKIMRYQQRQAALDYDQQRQVKPKKRKPVLTASAVNRQREQQRIEQENLALLKRLQTTSATKTLRRDRLLHDYQGKLLGGQSVAAAHKGISISRPSSAHKLRYTPNYYESALYFNQPATVTLNGDGTKRRTRPCSASVVRPHSMAVERPPSATKRPQSAKFS